MQTTTERPAAKAAAALRSVKAASIRHASHADRLAAFRETYERWLAAARAVQAVPADADEDEFEPIQRRCDDALADLIRARAPDTQTMALKGQVMIQQVLRPGDRGTAIDGDYLSFLLAETSWDEEAVISLYQDAVALSGGPAEISEARPVRFDPIQWLSETAVRAGCRYSVNGQSVTWEGPGCRAASDAYHALPSYKRHKVLEHVRHQSRKALQLAAGPMWEKPTTAGGMIRAYAAAAAVEAAKGGVEAFEVLRVRLHESMRRASGLAVGLPGFDAEAFFAEVRQSGMRFCTGRSGLDLLVRSGGSAPDPAAFQTEERFSQLDAEQVQTLATYVATMREWASGWLDQVTRETGCFISYHPGGVGFGVPPEGSADLDRAAIAYSALTTTQRGAVQALGQERDAAQRGQ